MTAHTLIWGIKRRFVVYLRSLPDGAFSVEGGASRVEGDLFQFPALPGTGGVEGARFGGAVRLMGHGGFLHVKVAHPALERKGGGLALTVADPFDDDVTMRIPFARLTPRSAGNARIFDATLAAEATELFAGRYPAGEPLDPVEVRLLTSPPKGSPVEALALTPKGR